MAPTGTVSPASASQVAQVYRPYHQVQLCGDLPPLLSSCQDSTEQQGIWEFVASFQDLILIGRKGGHCGRLSGGCPGQMERRNILLTTQPTCYCLIRSLGLIIFQRQRHSGTARLSVYSWSRKRSERGSKAVLGHTASEPGISVSAWAMFWVRSPELTCLLAPGRPFQARNLGSEVFFCCCCSLWGSLGWFWWHLDSFFLPRD